jgi:D-arabinose 1-dehydrogenase-like Zn-dependent alcohol dehydrogenase
MTLTLTALSHSATVGTYNKPVSHRALLARVPLQGQPAWQLVYAHPVPALGEGQVLIKTSHVGLNPFDWQCLEYGLGVGPEGKVMGRDGAGVVVGAGSGVHQFGVGDRVSRLGRSRADNRCGSAQIPR